MFVRLVSERIFEGYSQRYGRKDDGKVLPGRESFSVCNVVDDSLNDSFSRGDHGSISVWDFYAVFLAEDVQGGEVCSAVSISSGRMPGCRGAYGGSTAAGNYVP